MEGAPPQPNDRAHAGTMTIESGAACSVSLPALPMGTPATPVHPTNVLNQTPAQP